MLSIVYWLWTDNERKILQPRNRPPAPRHYTAAHVNAQLPMLEKWAGDNAYEVVCVTTPEHAVGLDPRIRVVPMPCEDIGAQVREYKWCIPCTRKLWSFSDEARILGDRVLLLDIDTVIVGPMDPIFARKEPIVVMGAEGWIYGGVFLFDTGAWNDLWEQFLAYPKKEELTDQLWITKYFGIGRGSDDLPHFGPEVALLGAHDKPKPGNSVMTVNMFFKPWEKDAEAYFPWLKGVHPMAFGT